MVSFLFSLLADLSKNSSVTQMDPYNIAICFAPNLCPIPEGYDQMQFTNQVKSFFLIFFHPLSCVCHISHNLKSFNHRISLDNQVNILIKNFIIFSKEIFGCSEVPASPQSPCPTVSLSQKRPSSGLPDLVP